MPAKISTFRILLSLELHRGSPDDALQLAAGDQRAGGGQRAEHHFQAQRAAREQRHRAGVHEELGDADQGRGNGAEGVRKRGSLRHGRHRNPDGEGRADQRAEDQAGDDPSIELDVMVEERTDDGGGHAALGQKHAAARRVGMAEPLEAEDEQNGRDQISEFKNVIRAICTRCCTAWAGSITCGPPCL